MPSFDAVDAGTGGGAGAGAAGGQGGGQGAAGTGGGAAGTGGSGGGSPIELSDSTPIIVGGKQTTWGEHRAASFVPKSDYDNVKKLTHAEITNNLRNLAIKMQQGQKRPNGQQQQQQGRVDPFAKVRDLPLVDGNTLAELAAQGFGEVGQTIQQQQQAIQQLAGLVKKLQGGVGTLAKERSGQERQSRLTAAISSLGEGYDPKDEFLQDIAQDVLDAWEFEKPDEFPQMFAKRIQSAEKWVRARDAAKLKAAKERRFVRPGGGATPSGGARPDPRMAASQAADMLFGPRNGANAT
jgi:hypothetical protein